MNQIILGQIPPSPGSVALFIDPANNHVSIIFDGPDPLTQDEAKKVQEANGYPIEAHGFRNFKQTRGSRTWATRWNCDSEPRKDQS